MPYQASYRSVRLNTVLVGAELAREEALKPCIANKDAFAGKPCSYKVL